MEIRAQSYARSSPSMKNNTKFSVNLYPKNIQGSIFTALCIVVAKSSQKLYTVSNPKCFTEGPEVIYTRFTDVTIGMSWLNRRC